MDSKGHIVPVEYVNKNKFTCTIYFVIDFLKKRSNTISLTCKANNDITFPFNLTQKSSKYQCSNMMCFCILYVYMSSEISWMAGQIVSPRDPPPQPKTISGW